MQNCGVITLRPLRLAEIPGATAEMHFPRCHSAREREHRGNSGQYFGSIASVFFTIRLATISLTADSTKPVAIRCPAR